MGLPLPVLIAGIVALLGAIWLGFEIVASRRAGPIPDETDETAELDAIEAVLVDEPEPVLPPSDALLPRRATAATVYPVHTLQAVADQPMTIAGAHRDPNEDAMPERVPTSTPTLPDPVAPEPTVAEPIVAVTAAAAVAFDRRPRVPASPPLADTAPPVSKVTAVPVLRAVPTPEPELAPPRATEPMPAPKLDPEPDPRVAELAAQIEVLTDTIAQLSARLEAAEAPPPASRPVIASVPAPMPKPARAAESMPARVPVSRPMPARAPVPAPPSTPAPSKATVPAAAHAPTPTSRPAVRPRALDDDLMSWPSDAELERFSQRQERDER